MACSCESPGCRCLSEGSSTRAATPLAIGQVEGSSRPEEPRTQICERVEVDTPLGRRILALPYAGSAGPAVLRKRLTATDLPRRYSESVATIVLPLGSAESTSVMRGKCDGCKWKILDLDEFKEKGFSVELLPGPGTEDGKCVGDSPNCESVACQLGEYELKVTKIDKNGKPTDGTLYYTENGKHGTAPHGSKTFSLKKGAKKSGNISQYVCGTEMDDPKNPNPKTARVPPEPLNPKDKKSKMDRSAVLYQAHNRTGVRVKSGPKAKKNVAHRGADVNDTTEYEFNKEIILACTECR